MKYLFFDFDGTIANTEVGIINALEHMAETVHLDNLGTDTYRKFIGPTISYSLEKYYPNLPKEKYPETIKAYQNFYNTKGIYQLEIYPHMKDILTQLQNDGYKLYVSSVKPESLIKILIPHLGLESYFSGLYGASDDESTTNSKAAILRNGLTDANANPKESIMIGDRLTDMEGGLKNHVHTLGITYGFGDHKELQDSGAELIVKHVQDIPAGVKKFN